VHKKVWINRVALTSSFLLEYSSENLNEYSINIESSLIQAVDDEEMVLVQGNWGQKGQGLEKDLLHMQAYIQIYTHARKWTNEIAKFQVSKNSNNSSVDWFICNGK